jgi:hypothetical protein
LDDGCWGVGAAAFTTYGIVATGHSSGAPIGSIDGTRGGVGQIFGGNGMEVFDGKLVVSLNSSSPSGTATPGANKEVLRLDLQAVGDDITVTGLTLTANSTSAWDGAADTVQLTNVGGTVVYDTSVAAADSFDNAVPTVFPNGAWTNALVIAEGTTVTIKVIGDTTGGAVNNTLQLSILNNLAGLTWTDVSGVGPTTVGTQIIPLYGNTLRY